jgi:hypothetical protein
MSEYGSWSLQIYSGLERTSAIPGGYRGCLWEGQQPLNISIDV